MIADSILRNLVVFVKVAEAQSFALAAEQVGLSRSAVGKSIARLEGRLQVRLFNRTTRSLSLTDEGYLLYDSCLSAVTELEAAASQLEFQRQVPAGRVRIDLPIVFGREWIVPTLLEVARKYPEIILDVSFNNRFVDLVSEGIDLAVRIGELSDATEMISTKLGTHEMVLCGSPDYFAEKGYPTRITDLDDHNCLPYSYAGRTRPWHLKDEDGKIRTKTMNGVMRFSSGDSIASAALAGFGIAELPTWLVFKYLRSGDLEVVLQERTADETAISLVWPKVKKLAPKTRTIVDELKQQFLPDPPWSLAE